ncbi:MAG TPA: methionine/alanine import family NSS transporter small subunit [Ruania sp.]|nr:methionine/alanine import family NSS transporter small subunit [Ruania sp.]
MDVSAIIMMIIAIVLIWGGLVAALIHLRRHPDPEDADEPAGTAPPGPGYQ